MNDTFIIEGDLDISSINETILCDKKIKNLCDNELNEDVPEKILRIKKRISENKFTYNIGHWTKKEHQKFIKGLDLFENDYIKISNYIKTRSVVQVRSHSQKFFKKYKEKLINNKQFSSMRENIGSFSIKQLIKLFTQSKKDKNSSNDKIKETLINLTKRTKKKLSKYKRKILDNTLYSNCVIYYL